MTKCPHCNSVADKWQIYGFMCFKTGKCNGDLILYREGLDTELVKDIQQIFKRVFRNE